MKCPFKKQVILKDYMGHKVSTTSHKVAEVYHDFGECDQRNCAAWNSYKGKCMLVCKENNV